MNDSEIKYTVVVRDKRYIDDPDGYVLSQFFYIHNNDELMKFVQMMAVDHKKYVTIYQGKYGEQ